MEKKEYLVEITYVESGEHEVVTIKTEQTERKIFLLDFQIN